MNTAPERLDRFLSDRKLRNHAFARLLGCSKGFISHMTSGRRLPGLALAVAIKRETASWEEGPILPEEWVPAEWADCVARVPPEPTSGEATVVVRVAVAAWPSGYAGAVFGDVHSAEELGDEGCRISYVTARVPRPIAPAEVPGAVSHG